MLSNADFQALGRLLDCLYLSMNVKCALMDETMTEVYTSADKTAFCAAIAATGDGYQRCVDCDRKALADVAAGRAKQYRCHAGLIECALPVTESGRTVAIIVMGQILDDSPREEQWRRVKRRCGWYPDLSELYGHFMKLRRMSAAQLNACAEIVNACVSEVRLSGLVEQMRQDDGQRLDSYIAANYAARASVTDACAHLAMSKTKLYNLCRERYGATFTELVTARRVQNAKRLLASTRRSVADIAEAVGIPDANYFAKVFRQRVGVTPREYRRGGKP